MTPKTKKRKPPEVNELLIEDEQFDWGCATIHFPDRDEDENNFILDIGSDVNKVGIEAWVTIEGELNTNPGKWNVFQVSVMLRMTYKKSVSLADLDNLDTPLEEFPDLLALAQQAIDGLKERHSELR